MNNLKLLLMRMNCLIPPPNFGQKKIIEPANTVLKNCILLVSRDTKNLVERKIFPKTMKMWPKMIPVLLIMEMQQQLELK